MEHRAPRSRREARSVRCHRAHDAGRRPLPEEVTRRIAGRIRTRSDRNAKAPFSRASCSRLLSPTASARLSSSREACFSRARCGSGSSQSYESKSSSSTLFTRYSVCSWRRWHDDLALWPTWMRPRSGGPWMSQAKMLGTSLPPADARCRWNGRARNQSCGRVASGRAGLVAPPDQGLCRFSPFSDATDSSLATRSVRLRRRQRPTGLPQ